MGVDHGVAATVRATPFIDRMRLRQAGLFTSTVTVSRGAGEGTWDPEAGTWTPGAGTDVYEGPALVRATQRRGAREDDLGELGATVLAPFTAKLPPDTDVRRGDTITVTASEHDASLVGLDLYVLHVPYDEWQIARVALCTDQAEAVPT